MKIVKGERSEREYNSTSSDAFDSSKSIEFGKKHRKRNVISNNREQLGLTFNKDCEYQLWPICEFGLCALGLQPLHSISKEKH